VAIVGPILDASSFGGNVALPLVCATAEGAVVGTLQSELGSVGGLSTVSSAVGTVATTVVTSCEKYGSSGAAALQSLNTSLSDLSAIDPSANSAILALARIVNTPSSLAFPFSGELTALSNLLSFFQSS
jgi:hypothetical protein